MPYTCCALLNSWSLIYCTALTWLTLTHTHGTHAHIRGHTQAPGETHMGHLAGHVPPLSGPAARLHWLWACLEACSQACAFKHLYGRYVDMCFEISIAPLTHAGWLIGVLSRESVSMNTFLKPRSDPDGSHNWKNSKRRIMTLLERQRPGLIPDGEIQTNGFRAQQGST